MLHTFSKSLLIIFALIFTSSVLTGKNARSNTANDQQSLENSAAEQAEYLPDMLVVKFKNRMSFGEKASGTGISSVDAIFRRYDVTEMRQFVKASFIRKDIDNSVAMESIYNLTFRGDHSPLEVAQALSSDPNVAYAEPKYIAYIDDAPNDTLYSAMSQFARVQAEAAWNVVKGETGNVIIAVVDGGTDWDHQDLIDNIWSNPGEIPNNGVDDDGNGFVDDVRGWNFANNTNDPTGLPNTPTNASHGTHTAGTAAAVTNNSIGVASISWNCTLMPVNTASPSNDRSVAFGYDGIAYAAANGADVINCSWGAAGTGSSLEQDVINFAHANGALVVAAAGNNSTNNDISPHFPSNYNHVLSVGATNKTSDAKASFSHYGVTVDVFAPGSSILSTFPNDNYSSFFSGTSMASPLAAGLAGLVKTLHPEFTPDQLREQIRVTSDPIDNANPGFVGLLGKGRINAFRAVTEFSNPAIRILDVRFTDSGGDGVIDAGETVDLDVDFINYLSAASQVNFTLIAQDNNITITGQNAGFSSLATNEVQTATFQFSIAAGVADGYTLRFYTDIASGIYSDRDFFSLTVTPPRFVTHNTGTVQTSITTEGNIGFTGFAGTPGVGFVHDGNGYLFEGGLLIGTGPATISDCVRGPDGGTQDNDFAPAANEELVITSPGEFTSEEGSILLTDSLAANILGLSVLQKSFADTRPENQDFVIFSYTIFNNSSMERSNMFVGLYFDWDINTSANDFARYDASRKTGYAMNAATSPTRIAATRLLTSSANVNYRAIHNPNELYDGFTDTEKWAFLSGGIQTETLDNVDVSTILSAGPFTLPANGSIDVAFAVIGASSIAELQQNADAAQLLWDNPTAINDAGDQLPQSFQLDQNYPNPFNPSTTIRYVLAKTTDITLEIFNTLGQKVRTLVNSRQSTGEHTVVWDGKDGNGSSVASGIYLYRLNVENRRITRKMLLLR